jgi:hypothetical protein
MCFVSEIQSISGLFSILESFPWASFFPRKSLVSLSSLIFLTSVLDLCTPSTSIFVELDSPTEIDLRESWSWKFLRFMSMDNNKSPAVVAEENLIFFQTRGWTRSSRDLFLYSWANWVITQTFRLASRLSLRLFHLAVTCLWFSTMFDTHGFQEISTTPDDRMLQEVQLVILSVF